MLSKPKKKRNVPALGSILKQQPILLRLVWESHTEVWLDGSPEESKTKKANILCYLRASEPNHEGEDQQM